jgi:hypothetical protein
MWNWQRIFLGLLLTVSGLAQAPSAAPQLQPGEGLAVAGPAWKGTTGPPRI